MPKFTLTQNGQQVQEAINKILSLGPATSSVSGTMSASDKAKLDSLGIHYGTTAHWNSQRGYVPKAGEIIIYSDHSTRTVDGKQYYVPGIKIGSGNGYVQDLMFVGGEESQALLEHISDTAAHTTSVEKMFWNSKLNVNDRREVVGEALILNRN